jgi:hypothetical protein
MNVKGVNLFIEGLPLLKITEMKILLLLALYCINIALSAQSIDPYSHKKKYETSINDNVIVFHRDSLQKANKYNSSLQTWLAISDTSKTVEKHYQLAVNYAKLDEIDSAFFYLYNFIKVSKDDRLILVDKAFDNLRLEHELWMNLTRKIETSYLSQIAQVLDRDLTLQLFYLNISMHKYGHFFQLLEYEDSIPTYQIAKNRNANWEQLQGIIDRYGFPTQAIVGNLGEQTAMALLNQQTITKNDYLTIKNRFYHQTFDTLAYALITDRYLLGKGKKQCFGSQFYYASKNKDKEKSWVLTLWPVRDFKKVNERRKEMGFAETVEEYAKRHKAAITSKDQGGVKDGHNALSNKIYEKNPNRIIICGKDSLQKDGEYHASIQSYLKNIDTLNIPLIRYRMAVNYAKLNILDSAFFYLNHYIDISEDDRLIIVDKDFDSLRVHVEKWKNLTKRIEDGYLQCLDSTKNKEIALQLFYLGIEDQEYRTYLSALNQIEYDSNGRFRIYINHKEINMLAAIIKKYGYPTISMVGHLASANAFLILQHSDKITKYYPQVKKIYKDGEISSQDFAMITDRCLMDRGRKQLYGTQLFKDNKTEKKYPGKYILWPVKDFKNVNKRRKDMGFSETVEEYVASWNSENDIIPAKYYKQKTKRKR